MDLLDLSIRQRKFFESQDRFMTLAQGEFTAVRGLLSRLQATISDGRTVGHCSPPPPSRWRCDLVTEEQELNLSEYIGDVVVDLAVPRATGQPADVPNSKDL